MTELVTFTVVGLAIGAIYSIASAGLVVTYTTSGIFNFAHGAIGMFTAFIYWQLRWDAGWGGQWPAPIAMLFVLFIVAPIIGVFPAPFGPIRPVIFPLSTAIETLFRAV